MILTIFCLVYLALAIGHLPGFRLDRTGAAMVGAMLLLVFGYITPAEAWDAIDYPTIGLLFGLMVISAAFKVAGFYDRVAWKIGSFDVGPKTLLAIVIAVSGGLSALLTNDVIVLAMTPMFCAICQARRLNPVPFLLAFCYAANIGAAATLIGSPQNMIAVEALRVSFVGLAAVALVPVIISLPLIWVVMVWLYRGQWHLAEATDAPLPSVPPTGYSQAETLQAALVATAVVIAFIVTDWPHMLVAMAGASFLLVSRRYASDDMISEVDGNLILLLFGLFVVNAALATTGIPQEALGYMRDAGFDLREPVSMMAIMSVLSNIIGNNPAVMLVMPLLGGAEHANALGAAITIGTGFASNALIFGSLAGIIVTEESRRSGVVISFRDFSRAGVPVAVLSLLVAAGWMLYLGY
ncbi:MAG: hypothetical protein LBE50_03535 [Gallionellaceae bacterium]|jgi:Na+/H+ antiporter NhaD/arsenite permease-like protein|nr:hypothetical protein [Gallionellaceae bacterium]